MNSRSHAVSTERTILSPFTKEYRVLVAYKWHTLIFGGASPNWGASNNSIVKLLTKYNVNRRHFYQRQEKGKLFGRS